MTESLNRVLGAFIVLGCIGVGAATAVAAGEHQSGRVVLVVESDQSGEVLSPHRRTALKEALHAIASEAGVVICSPGGRQASDPAFQDHCTRSTSPLPLFLWRADVEVRRANLVESMVITLTLQLESRHEVGPGLFSFNQNHALSEGTTVEDRERELVRRMGATLRGQPEIRRWFESLTEIEDLLVARPASAPADRDPPEQVEADSEFAEVWRQERNRVEDLMIDGHYDEALRIASGLLADPGIPEGIAARMEQLIAIADQRLREREEIEITEIPAEVVEPAEPEPPAVAPEPVPEPTPEPVREIFDFTFVVKSAAAGQGLVKGARGRLRVSDEGARFRPDDADAGEPWSVPWADFSEAGAADGIWDTRYPLMIRRKSGVSHFFVEITPSGQFGDGALILKKLREGSKRSTKR